MDAEVVTLQSPSVNVVLWKSKQYLYSKCGAANVSTEVPFSIRFFRKLTVGACVRFHATHYSSIDMTCVTFCYNPSPCTLSS